MITLEELKLSCFDRLVNRRDTRTILIAPLMCVAFFCAQMILNLKLRVLDAAWVEPPPSAVEKVNSKLLETISFGNIPIVVDFLWMKSLQDPTLSPHTIWPEGQHPPVYYDVDLATDLDPAFYEAYYAGANLLSILRNDGRGARDMLLKGEAFQSSDLSGFPALTREINWGQDWQIPLLLAYVYLFDLNDMSNAAHQFEMASASPKSPQYLQHLVQRLRVPGGQYEVGLKLISFLMSMTQDEVILKEYDQKREALFFSQYLYLLNQQFGEFLRHIPDYRTSTNITQQRMQSYWRKFLSDNNHAIDRDPWGGQLSWDPAKSKIVSTTPHMAVFGLE